MREIGAGLIAIVTAGIAYAVLSAAGHVSGALYIVALGAITVALWLKVA